MADFTENQIQQMMTTLKWEYGIDNNTRELAILELEDLKRKGCTLEHIGECRGNCSACKGDYCPLNDWEKRHPEYANDELAMRIKILEAGGEEAYKAKLAAQEEAKKRAEEEAKNEASNIALANDLKNDIIKTANCECTSHHLQDLLERYVQIRIYLAIKNGKTQI